MGYFAVSFSLGIIARDCGFNPFHGFLASITTYASAGQYIGYTLYAAGATLIELIIMTIITNARYVLMGFALNQRLPEGSSLGKRLIAGVTITDEIFGITIAQPGYIDPLYPLGAWVMASPMWATGNALGISMGHVLPIRVVSCLSVALFGMFLAVIVPASKKDKVVAAVVLISFGASFGIGYIPVIGELSSGNRTIILTLLISGIAALLFPRTTEIPSGGGNSRSISAGDEKSQEISAYGEKSQEIPSGDEKSQETPSECGARWNIKQKLKSGQKGRKDHDE